MEHTFDANKRKVREQMTFTVFCQEEPTGLEFLIGGQGT